MSDSKLPPADPVIGEPPRWLKQFFIALRFTLSELHDAIVLFGIILITALAIYGLIQDKVPATNSPPIIIFQPRQQPKDAPIFRTIQI